MSKKARGRQMQAQSKKGNKGKGAKRPPPAGRWALPASRPSPAGLPGGMPSLPPGQGLPDLTQPELRPVQGRAALGDTAAAAPRGRRAARGGAPRRLGA